MFEIILRIKSGEWSLWSIHGNVCQCRSSSEKKKKTQIQMTDRLIYGQNIWVRNTVSYPLHVSVFVFALLSALCRCMHISSWCAPSRTTQNSEYVTNCVNNKQQTNSHIHAHAVKQWKAIKADYEQLFSLARVVRSCINVYNGGGNCDGLPLKRTWTLNTHTHASPSNICTQMSNWTYANNSPTTNQTISAISFSKTGIV